jgi:hypothetical protein
MKGKDILTIPFVVTLHSFQFMVCCVAKLDTPSPLEFRQDEPKSFCCWFGLKYIPIGFHFLFILNQSFSCSISWLGSGIGSHLANSILNSFFTDFMCLKCSSPVISVKPLLRHMAAIKMSMAGRGLPLLSSRAETLKF